LEIHEKFNKKVIISPLEWGLGHATRCIPIIKKILADGGTVVIATSGQCLALLRQEFPQLAYIDLPSYNVHYRKLLGSVVLSLFAQSPKMLKAAKQERKIINDYVTKNSADIIISDNRYGAYHKKLRNIFITHQLGAFTGWGKLADAILMRLHFNKIKHFNEIWVPDLADYKTSLAGKLSHVNYKPKQPITYIGPITRFTPNENVAIEYDFTAIISGPEPARSRMEQSILQFMETYTGKAALVRGMPDIDEPQTHANKNFTIYNHLTAKAIEQLIKASKIIISRTGYTTVMDLYVLNKPAIMVATPGQTEQVYLAEWLKNHPLFTIATEENLFDVVKQKLCK
jgi:uncharacterized protein (TIGR00661 family)